VEPFAGGAHAGLAAGIEGMVDQVLLVEIDDNVGAIWKEILEGDYKWLIKRISNFEMSLPNIRTALADGRQSDRKRAFSAILQNRISRGGVVTNGSGILNRGEDDRGLLSRWYPDTLIKRIDLIATARDRMRFIHDDGVKVMSEYKDRSDAIFFVDPPYPEAGKRLYTHSDVDPNVIFEICSQVEGDFLITYNRSDTIIQMCQHHGFDFKMIEMSNSHHSTKIELIISESMDWMTKSV
jgi:DNA adenine methylase